MFFCDRVIALKMHAHSSDCGVEINHAGSCEPEQQYSDVR